VPEPGSSLDRLICGGISPRRLYLLFGLPVLIGQTLGFFAARRRVRMIWPMLGILATCCFGALTNVSFNFPPLVQRAEFGAGIGITTGPALASIALRAAVSAAFALLPYFVMRRLFSSNGTGLRDTPT
jgi:hypothetical protein